MIEEDVSAVLILPGLEMESSELSLSANDSGNGERASWWDTPSLLAKSDLRSLECPELSSRSRPIVKL
jgi:hypothetical protein